MAPETKQKKRKAAASAASPTAKKSKKTALPPAPAAVTKPTTGATTRSSSNASKVAVRKKAADFMSDGSNSEDDGWAALEAKNQKGKKVSAANNDKTKKVVAPKKGKNNKRGKNNEKENGVEPSPAQKKRTQNLIAGLNSIAEETVSLVVPDGALVQADDSADDSAEEEIDDQTATLLKGFESSEDEEENDEAEGPTPKQMAGAKIPDEKETREKIKALAARDKSTLGVIYLGRVPHGFYEEEMRSYFSQFGTVTRLRLSRNKKTGNSKHYAFIEFADSEVAKIVAETMNNYLLFNHILRCKTVPRDDLEFIEKLFKGSGKKFKPRPAAKLHQRVLERKRTEEQWGKELVKETSKRRSINQRMKNKGIDYEYEAPEVRKAEPEPMEIDDVPIVAAKEAPATVTEETVVLAATKEPALRKVTSEKKGKNSKKGKRNTAEVAAEEPITVVTLGKEILEKAAPGKGKKGKKGEKKGITEAASTLAVDKPITKEGVPETVVTEKRKGRKGKIAAEAPLKETAAEVIPERRRGKRGRKEVVEQAVEKVAEETVEAVTEDDGIDEVEVQAAIKKAKSKSMTKSPAKAKSPAGKVVKKSVPKKKSKA